MYNMSMNDRQIAQLEIVKTKVRQLLGGDTSGHADDHVERVALLAERFANECNESVNLQEVLLTAWLHDVDDYKLVGKTQAEKLTNAVNIMAHEYNTDGNTHDTDGFINHFFEKLLKLKGLMLTEPGRAEAENRHQIMVDFLRAYFREKNAPEWSGFLEEYLRSVD